MAFKIKGEMSFPAGSDGAVMIGEEYTHRTGLRRMQEMSLEKSSDFVHTKTRRYSEDNGRSWGPWEDRYAADYSAAPDGSWEFMYTDAHENTWNPVHKHYIGFRRLLIWRGGHLDAYHSEWSQGKPGFSNREYFLVRGEGECEPRVQWIQFEPGMAFDPADPLNETSFAFNDCATYMPPLIDNNGDVLFTLETRMSTCLRILGIDPAEIFPSRPEINWGVLFVRAKWDGERYNFSFSRPIVLSDLESSRGLNEPALAQLENGRILLVMRGSNARAEWRRMPPGVPGFKWYCWSDDGGKTFTRPMPWHYDNGEVLYSSATISKFIRSEKNGKLYWIGNITDHHVDANWPRFPLQIAEVDGTYGFAKKDTVTVIDTRREGETDQVQLSNFGLLQDRETGNIELRLTKIGQFDKKDIWRCEAWKYTIHL